jgi:hypothetical protein
MDSISIRPPQRAAPEPKQNPEEIEQEESRRKAERQRAFAIQAGRPVTSGSPADQNNKRQQNLLRQGSTGNDSQKKTDYTLMYGIAAFWDLATFLVALVPAAGWAINGFILFPAGLFNMYMMAQSRGKNTAQFWGAYKYIFIKAVPYIDIVPAFVRGVIFLESEGKEGGLASITNAVKKISSK